jgi:hypothetical protein
MHPQVWMVIHEEAGNGCNSLLLLLLLLPLLLSLLLLMLTLSLMFDEDGNSMNQVLLSMAAAM